MYLNKFKIIFVFDENLSFPQLQMNDFMTTSQYMLGRSMPLQRDDPDTNTLLRIMQRELYGCKPTVGYRKRSICDPYFKTSLRNDIYDVVDIYESSLARSQLASTAHATPMLNYQKEFCKPGTPQLKVNDLTVSQLPGNMDSGNVQRSISANPYMAHSRYLNTSK